MARRDSSPRKSVAGKRRAGGIPFHRRHRKALVVLVSVVGLALGTVTGYAYWLNSQLGNVERVDTDAIKNRPDPDEGKALNILLLGSDKGEPQGDQSGSTTVAEDATAGSWPSGKYRSDTMMIAHISEDRRSVDLVSIPRDTSTMIYDAEGDPTSEQKINAAFSEHGPNGAIATVEQLTGLRMAHLAIIDWDGFKDLSSAVGGVPVTIPEAFYDPKQDLQWEAGEQTLEGEKALAYVRTRYGLLRGDFDRIARQQNFLRSLMKEMLASGTTTNPVKLTRTLGAVTENLTVDGDWAPQDMRALALSLRGTKADDVTFLTAPVATTEDVAGLGNVVRLDEAKSKELFTALGRDSMGSYLKKYPDDKLASEDEID
ncbi:LCP family protein [Aeromicrobium sp. CF4.19]|uniref:LCP family protein n=1 Tax=Aeromicrobium sp. CF4.19 TaxID=3373082 RepID=UPI003EE6FB2E